jgi:hypothetical protein
MLRRAAWLAVLACCTLGAPAEAASCPAPLSLNDDRGDVSASSLADVEAPALDILEYEMERTPTSLVLRLSLAEKPGTRVNEYYRYWLGFDVRKGNEEAHYMDVRIATTATYDEAGVVGPGSMGNPRLGMIPITWNGTTVTAEVPLAMLEAALGAPLVFEEPIAASDGIHRSPELQGPAFAAPYVQDYTPAVGGADEGRALGACVPEAGAAVEAAPATDAETPWPGAFVVFALAGVALLRRGRR